MLLLLVLQKQLLLGNVVSVTAAKVPTSKFSLSSNSKKNATLRNPSFIRRETLKVCKLLLIWQWECQSDSEPRTPFIYSFVTHQIKTTFYHIVSIDVAQQANT